METSKVWRVSFTPAFAYRPGIPDSVPMECNVLADTAVEAIEKIRTCNMFAHEEIFELVSVNPVEYGGEQLVIYDFGNLESVAQLPRDESFPIASNSAPLPEQFTTDDGLAAKYAKADNDFEVREDGPSQASVPAGAPNITPVYKDGDAVKRVRYGRHQA